MVYSRQCHLCGIRYHCHRDIALTRSVAGWIAIDGPCSAREWLRPGWLATNLSVVQASTLSTHLISPACRSVRRLQNQRGAGTTKPGGQQSQQPIVRFTFTGRRGRHFDRDLMRNIQRGDCATQTRCQLGHAARDSTRRHFTRQSRHNKIMDAQSRVIAPAKRRMIHNIPEYR